MQKRRAVPIPIRSFQMSGPLIDQRQPDGSPNRSLTMSDLRRAMTEWQRRYPKKLVLDDTFGNRNYPGNSGETPCSVPCWNIVSPVDPGTVAALSDDEACDALHDLAEHLQTELGTVITGFRIDWKFYSVDQPIVTGGPISAEATSSADPYFRADEEDNNEDDRLDDDPEEEGDNKPAVSPNSVHDPQYPTGTDSPSTETPLDDQILMHVIKITSEQMKISLNQVDQDTNFVVDLGADSLDTVELVMELEEDARHCHVITDEDAETVHTVRDAVILIQKLDGKVPV